MSLRVLLYEPNHTGHHFPYLARMLPALIHEDVELILATTEAGLLSEEFSLTLAAHSDHLRIDTCCTPPPSSKLSRRKNAKHRLMELISAIKTIRPNHVFVLYADGIWQLMQLRWLMGCWRLPSNMVIEGWIYRGGFTYPDAQRPIDMLNRLLFSRMVKNGPFDALHLDDEIMLSYAKRHVGAKGPRIVLTPNPVKIMPLCSKKNARMALGVREGGRCISGSGMIAPWKGMDLLVRAFAVHIQSNPDDWLLLAGPHSDEIHKLLARPELNHLVRAGSIISVDRFLTADEMFHAAAASDLVVAPYPNHSGRSSIILWAAAAGRPVLSVGRGCIGHVVREYNLGLTCDVKNHRVFVTALGEALNMPWSEDSSRRARSYARTHSIENYQASAGVMLSEMRERR